MLVNKAQRQHHSKSKNGCLICKKRKIKCDEAKPRCMNCVRFQVPCSFDSTVSTAANTQPSAIHASPTSPTKRGRGRPRKNWRRVLQNDSATAPAQDAKSSSNPRSLPTAEQLQATPAAGIAFYPVSGGDMELLIHFIQHTAPSLAHPSPPNNSIASFWAHNALQMGLSCHCLLHLALSLAAYHLADLTTDEAQTLTYRSLATQRGTLGLAELTTDLQTINDANCGALYAAATLVSFCTFAAGPTDADDLLVCSISSSNRAPGKWLSVVQGVRLIRETVDPAILFSGLMAPLGGAENAPLSSSEPRCVEDGFPRVTWEEPLHQLRNLIISSPTPDTEKTVFLKAYDIIEAIYNSTYGKDTHAAALTCNPRFKFVFIWLYAMDDRFVACLQQRHPLALLLLGYYAFLLTTLQRDWFIRSWPMHLLSRVRELVPEAYRRYLRWPLE